MEGIFSRPRECPESQTPTPVREHDYKTIESQRRENAGPGDRLPRLRRQRQPMPTLPLQLRRSGTDGRVLDEVRHFSSEIIMRPWRSCGLSWPTILER